jgi:hypothetical protein
MREARDKDVGFYERLEREVRDRMRDLEPAVQEYERLKGILDMVEADMPPASLRIDAHGHGPPPRRATARRRGEPRGRRAAQVVELLRSEPGLTRAEVAARLGIRVGYLYELLPTLEKKGYVQERDGSWFVA